MKHISIRSIRTNVVHAAVAAGLALAVSLSAAPVAAAAPGWTNVIDHSGQGVVGLCKTAIDSSAYGPLWRVKIAALSGRGHTASGTFTIRRNGVVVNTGSAYARDGQWVVTETYASRWYKDTIEGTAGSGNLKGNGMGGSFERVAVSSLVTCV